MSYLKENLKSHVYEISSISSQLDMSDFMDYQKDNLPGEGIDKLVRHSAPRADYLEGCFTRNGYDTFIQPFAYKDSIARNVIAKKSENPKTLITAHHDYWAGKGADDNASGMATLIELSEQLKHRDDVAFASFDLEEAGLQGSQYFLSESAHYPQEVICVDSIGSGSRVMYCRSFLKKTEKGTEEYMHGKINKDILEDLKKSSKSLPYEIEEGYMKGVMDLMSFPSNVKKAGIVSFESAGNYRRSGVMGKKPGVIHTKHDTPDKIDYEQLKSVAGTIIGFLVNVYSKAA